MPFDEKLSFEPGAPVAYTLLVLRAKGLKPPVERGGGGGGLVDSFVRVVANGVVEGETVVVPRSAAPVFAADDGATTPGKGGGQAVTLRGLRFVGSPKNRVRLECFGAGTPQHGL